MRLNGLKPVLPFLPDDVGGLCRRLDRGVVENPDSPDKAGGCRRPRDLSDRCLDDDNVVVLSVVEPGVLNCCVLGFGFGVVTDDENDDELPLD